MYCNLGFDLHEQYLTAETARKVVLERRRLADSAVTPKEVLRAKQHYVEHFANWLSHKAFCQDCKPQAPTRGQQMHSTAPGR